DRTGAGDEDVLTDHRKLQRGVNSVAERVEDRPQFGGDEVLAVDVVVHPDVLLRDDDELGEGAIALHAHAHHADAQLPPAGTAVAAGAAHHVPFAGDLVTHSDVPDQLAHRHHLAVELMAGDVGRLDHRGGPGVPVQDVQVRAADPGGEHPDLDLIRTWLRLRAFNEFEARLRAGFVQGAHVLPPGRCSGHHHAPV